MAAVLEIEKREGVATLTLNRPEARNALNSALRDALATAFASLDGDDETRVIILTGAGTAFCAGVDLKEAAQMDGAPSADDGKSCWQAMDACRKPIIGAINGACVTGGFEVALACDVLIASREARFADTHVRVGVVPGAGLSQRLPRAVGVYRAKYLSLTGNYLGAEQAERWGLVSHVVEPDALLATAQGMAREMLSTPPGMLAAVKRVIDDGFAQTLSEGMRIESEQSLEHIRREAPFSQVGERYASVRGRGQEQSRDADS